MTELLENEVKNPHQSPDEELFDRDEVEAIKQIIATQKLKNVREPFYIHWFHLVIHAASGLLVFSAGLCASHLLENWKARQPISVTWQSGEVQPDYIFKVNSAAPVGVKLEVGFAADGRVAWRVQK